MIPWVTARFSLRKWLRYLAHTEEALGQLAGAVCSRSHGTLDLIRPERPQPIDQRASAAPENPDGDVAADSSPNRAA